MVRARRESLFYFGLSLGSWSWTFTWVESGSVPTEAGGVQLLCSWSEGML